MALTKIDSALIAAGAITSDKIAGSVALGGPKISGLDYPGDDTAAVPAGGQTIAVNGSGFASGCAVFIDGVAVGVVSFISSTQLQFIAPAKATGLYTMYVVNPDGGTAILVPGMVYSGTPTWTTASGSIGTPYETNAFSVNVAATGDGALSYVVATGSSLPAGLSLSSGGAITGTVPATAADTTYTFNLEVIDSENQSTIRQFSVTYKVDVVTWSSPADGASFTWETNQANSTSLTATSAAGKSVSFSLQSGSLPANVTVSGSSITGTPSTAQSNTSAVIRATAADTNRYADRTLWFIINQPVVNPTLLYTKSDTTYHRQLGYYVECTNDYFVVLGTGLSNQTAPMLKGYSLATGNEVFSYSYSSSSTIGRFAANSTYAIVPNSSGASIDFINLANGNLSGQIGSQFSISTVKSSPDGTKIISNRSNDVAYVYQAQPNGSLLESYSNPNIDTTDTSDQFAGFGGLDINDTYVAVGAPFENFGGNDNAGAAYVFQRSNGSRVLTKSGSAASEWHGYEMALAGNKVYVGGLTNSTKIYDIPSGNLLQTLDVKGLRMAVSSNGNRIAISPGSNSAVKIYSVSSGELIHSISAPGGSQNWGTDVALSPDGSRLVVGDPWTTSGVNQYAGTVYVYSI